MLCKILYTFVFYTKISLYIKFNVNKVQKKFEVNISKHLAKITINWHKRGQMPLWRVNIKWA